MKQSDPEFQFLDHRAYKRELIQSPSGHRLGQSQIVVLENRAMQYPFPSFFAYRNPQSSRLLESQRFHAHPHSNPSKSDVDRVLQ